MVGQGLRGSLRGVLRGAVVVLLSWGFLVMGCGTAIAQLKEYAPPLSFSNAELSNRDFSGQFLRGAELSNANLTNANFSNAHLEGTAISASVLTDTNFSGADLTNALMDSSQFLRTDLSNAVLLEAVLVGSTFEDIKIEGADFSYALLGRYQLKQLCAIASGRNPTTGIDTRESLGCP